MTTPDLTPAAELRAAATLIRTHATRATPGPWTASPVWSSNAQNTSAVYSAALPPGSEVIGSTRSNAVVGPTQKFGGCWRPHDAEYIALMHPVVAVALADTLDRTAEVMEYLDATEVQLDGGRPMTMVVNGDGTSYVEWTAVLALARAVTDATAGAEATCLGRDMDCGRTLPCPDHGDPTTRREDTP